MESLLCFDKCCIFVKNIVYLKHLIHVLMSRTPRAISLVCMGLRRHLIIECDFRDGFVRSRVYAPIFFHPKVDDINLMGTLVTCSERFWWIVEWRERRIAFLNSILIVS